MKQHRKGREHRRRKDRNKMIHPPEHPEITRPETQLGLAEHQTADGRSPGPINNSHKEVSTGIKIIVAMIRWKPINNPMDETSTGEQQDRSTHSRVPTNGQEDALNATAVNTSQHKHKAPPLQPIAAWLPDKILHPPEQISDPAEQINFNRMKEHSTGAAVVEEKGHTRDQTAQPGQFFAINVGAVVTTCPSVAPRSVHPIEVSTHPASNGEWG